MKGESIKRRQNNAQSVKQALFDTALVSYCLSSPFLWLCLDRRRTPVFSRQKTTTKQRQKTEAIICLCEEAEVDGFVTASHASNRAGIGELVFFISSLCTQVWGKEGREIGRER